MPLANYKQYVNLVLGYAYYNITVVGTLSEPTNWKHTDSIAPKVGSVNRIPTNSQPNHDAVCRECYAPAKHHPVTDGYFKCSRPMDAIGQAQPDYGMFSNEHVEQPPNALRLVKAHRVDEDTDVNGVPFRSYEGPGTREEFSEWDATDYVSPTVEWDALDRWKDDKPPVAVKDKNGKFLYWDNLSTHVLDAWTATQRFTYTENHRYRTVNTQSTEPESRNAYVEGFDGFIALRLIDEYLTSKHHEHTLNVFRDRDNNLRVGGIIVETTVDGHIQARCVNRNCTGSDLVRLDDSLTRERMESFIYGIIAHGNNHAAHWFLTKTFEDRPKRINVGYDSHRGSYEDVVPSKAKHIPVHYKLHAQDCADIAKCNRMNVAYCPVKTGTATSVLTESEVVKFLLDHNDKCRDARCKCDEVLIDAVPALAHL